jgi:hypothetical protein
MPYRAQTRYHTQDKEYYCGAAVAMMLFEHLSIGGISQAYLYGIGSGLSADKADFYIDPEGLKGLLNQRLEEKGHPARYELRYFPTGLEAVQELAASLAQQPTLPGFTLQSIHWVLVDGVEQQGDATGTRTSHLWLHYPIVDQEPPPDLTPPHSAVDVCGSSNRHGLLQAAFSAKAWSDILKPHPKLGSVPLVIIPPPADAPRLPLAEEDDAQSPLPGWVAESFPEAVFSIGEPIAVAAPPEQGGDYQLAPLLAPEGQLGWVLNEGGKRQGLGLFSKPQPIDLLTEEQAIEYGQKEFATDETPLGPPTFSWRVSRESPTRFFPFREVRFDADRTAFVRLDHQTFHRLSVAEKSG